MELQEVSQPAPEVPLAVEIQAAIMQEYPSPLAEGKQRADAVAKMSAAVFQLLIERGHVIPGAPPAKVILHDAQTFAARLMLSNLALRVLNMLAFTNVQTPETKPARKWIDDYLQGVNHGPVGHPMIWPGNLPGMAAMLRDWGFIPTVALPGQPSYVARAVQAPTVQ